MSSRYDGEVVVASSSTALLSGAEENQYGSRNPTLTAAAARDDGGVEVEAVLSSVPQDKRQLGVLSAVSLIFNRMIGTGIYATSSLILRASGSVGMFLALWVLGAIIASTGMAVYVEFGTGLPRSGGEKNYLEYVFQKPKLLVTCCYAIFICLLGWSGANSVVFGEYMIHAFGGEITQWNTRVSGLICLTGVSFIHAFYLNLGLRLQNILALAKLGVLFFIIFCGFLAFVGWVPISNRPHNFDNIWEGTSGDPNALVTGLYSVIWAFIGYSNAHYALSETKNPVLTIKRAAPLAMILITVMYLLVNVAYLVVIPKEQIRDGGRVVAAYYFHNLFGGAAERTLSIVICLSTLGNVVSTSFTQGRVIQELGREGVLPYSAVFASNAPYNTPFAALVLQWLMSAISMLCPPPGDAFNFILNLTTYPYSIINMAVAGGLLWLYLPSRGRDWDPPYRAGVSVIVLFLLSNIFLTFAPLIPPSPGFSLYEHLPYWLHAGACIGLLFVGVIYWYVWVKILPRLRSYKLEDEVASQEDEVPRAVSKKIR